VLPAGLRLLTLNGREHWAERNRRYQALKKAAWATALKARLPRLSRVAVTLAYDPPDRRHRDADNLAATLKPCIDGLVAARVIPRDDERYLAAAACEIGGRPFPGGRVRLTVREITRRGPQPGGAA
jgi:crossover junction endodeoxyribonuclease RusA